MPDRTKKSQSSGQTGAIRRTDLEEPRLQQDPPRPPSAPELPEAYESTTGMMPAQREPADKAVENQDADAPV